MADPLVVLAATPRGWAAALHAHATDHGGVIVRATVLSAVDARQERCDVLVVDDITSFLTIDLVSAVHQQGRVVLGIHDPDEPAGRDRLAAAGVDGLLAVDADPVTMVATIQALSASRANRPIDVGTAAQATPIRAASSRVIGVTGPAGGVGVTEVAIELAALLSSTGRSTVLLDADEQAPSHAQRLQLALQPNVLGAVDAQRRGAALTEGLHPLSSRHPLRALPGMSVAEDWGTVPAGALEDLVDGLASSQDVVVVDLGHCPNQVDTLTGTRYGHAGALAARCSELVVVVAPTPTAVTRALLLRARLRTPATEVRVMLNRDIGDAFVRRECTRELQRGMDVEDVPVVAEDHRVPRAAWQGQRVARGRFSRQIRDSARRWGWAA